ncbi:hypothetical protein [Treponema sp. R6D11]
MKKYENEEQLKENIFETYSKWLVESSSDRFLTYYTQLLEQIYTWCKDFSFKKNINNMGEEITVVTKRIMERKDKIPTDKKIFFYYLSKALKKEKSNFYRKYNTEDIRIPKEIKAKIRDSEDVLRMKERNLGRKLTKDEKITAVSDWFGISIKRATNIVKAMDICGINFTNNNKNEDGKTIDILNSATTSIYMENKILNPLDEYLIKIDRKHILETVEYLLKKKQERARGCYKALFTLHCIENYKDFEGLYPVLDSQVLETWQKEGKEPNQYEIYQKYHHKVKQKSAEAQASKNLGKFLDDIRIHLKEKNK